MYICPRARSARKFWDFDPSYMQKCPKNCPILSSPGYFKKSPPPLSRQSGGGTPPHLPRSVGATFRFRVAPPTFGGGHKTLTGIIFQKWHSIVCAASLFRTARCALPMHSRRAYDLHFGLSVTKLHVDTTLSTSPYTRETCLYW